MSRLWQVDELNASGTGHNRGRPNAPPSLQHCGGPLGVLAAVARPRCPQPHTARPTTHCGHVSRHPSRHGRHLRRHGWNLLANGAGPGTPDAAGFASKVPGRAAITLALQGFCFCFGGDILTPVEAALAALITNVVLKCCPSTSVPLELQW